MRKSILVWIITAICFISCGKTGDVVPGVAVNFTISRFDPSMAALTAPGGYVTISGYGVAGIIIYHRPDGTYTAYDRCSSYQPEKRCAVTIDDTGLNVTDPCSGSKFSLNDGSPVKAPAIRSLRVYQVNVSAFQINVYN
jgi:nitrite reductase/ring-hydroxylating ferredoxin subunit